MKYRVINASTTLHQIEVEANSEDQAVEQANKMDADEWSEIGEPNWELERVEPAALFYSNP